jgi:hypothetical protein
MSGRWALVTEGRTNGGSRAAVAAVRALVRGGYRAAVTISGGPTLAAASRLVSRRIHVPSGDLDPEAYSEALSRELKSGDYLAAFGASEIAALALDPSVLRFQDKLIWPAKARAAGLETPPTRVFPSLEELLAASQELEYPLIIKPSVKRFVAQRVRTRGELPSHVDGQGPLIVQPYLREPLGGVLGLMHEGNLIASVQLRYLRIWPYPCGTAAAAVTVPSDSRLAGQLEAFFQGYEGIFHVDLVGRYLIDVNPRLHATLPAAVASGVNLVALQCQLLEGRPVSVARGRTGVFFRWIEGDIRSVMRSVRQGEMNASAAFIALRPRRGTVHGFEAATDIAPVLLRLKQIARGLARGRQMAT